MGRSSAGTRTATTYWIDAGDRIVRVDDGFLDFAARNGASELTRPRVVGRSLWEFVEGAQTRELYARLLGHARERGRLLGLPFRCDSPDRRRTMRMTIAPGSGLLQVRSETVTEEARPAALLFDLSAPRSGRPLRVCSMCKRVYLSAEEEWFEVEAASKRLGLPAAGPPPPLRHTLCQDCEVGAALLAGGGG